MRVNVAKFVGDVFYTIILLVLYFLYYIKFVNSQYDIIKKKLLYFMHYKNNY
jgi:hypothetical protein